MTDNTAENFEPLPAETPPPAAPGGFEEAQKLKDQLLRALADTENLRKRHDKERAEIGQYAIANFAREILNVADNLRRTLDAVKPEDVAAHPALKTLLTGVELTEKSLADVLAKFGVVKIWPNIGDAFDYNLHQAMFEAEIPDKPPGTITQVLQAGYQLHSRLLRPAMVGVVKAPASNNGKVDVSA